MPKPDKTLELNSATLQRGPWSERIRRYEAARHGSDNWKRILPWIGLVLALGVAAVLLLYDHKISACIVLGITGALLIGQSASSSFRDALPRILQGIGAAAGKIFTWLLIGPVFYLGFVPARVYLRLLRRSPLALSKPEPGDVRWVFRTLDKRAGLISRMMFAREQKPRRSSGLINLTAGLFLVAVIGEIYCRARGFHHPVLYMSDVEAGYMLQPNQHVRMRGMKWQEGEVFINNCSMRNAEDITTEKPVNTLRILLLGDSTLFGGDYRLQSKIYGELLEKKLAGIAGKNVEVWNCGVNGWGPHHKLGYVRKYGVFNSDIALVCLPLVDCYRPKFRLEYWNWPCEKPTSALVEQVRRQVGQWLAVGRRNEVPVEQQPEYTRAVFSDGVKTYVELGELLRKQGTVTWFEILPGPNEGQDPSRGTFDAHYGRRHDELVNALSAAGFGAAYPITLFRDMKVDEDIFDDNIHLADKGHDIYAQYLMHQIVASERWRHFVSLR